MVKHLFRQQCWSQDVSGLKGLGFKVAVVHKWFRDLPLVL